MAQPAAGLERESWVLSILLVLSPLAIWRPAADPFNIPKVTLLVASVLLLAVLAAHRWIRTGRAAVPIGPAVFAAVAFGLALVLATVTSDNFAASVAGGYKRYTGLVVYVSYIVLFVAALRTITSATVPRLVGGLAAGGICVAVYGLLQLIDADPFAWQNLYGDAVFSTLGNPNFAGAYLGMAVSAVLWVALRPSVVAPARWAAGASVPVLILVAWQTNSFQGPLLVLIGAAVFALAWIRQQPGRLRTTGTAAWLAAVFVAAVVVAIGFAGGGPAARLKEERTLQLRGYYWDAAAEMFAAEPITGIGLDRYAAFYREYRSQQAAADVSFTASADNPHNTFLDMFAEGGLILGVAYLAFVGLVGFALVRGFVSLQGDGLLLLGAAGGGWLAYQTQSLISIDVTALAAPHWLLSAAILLIAWPPVFREFSFPWAAPVATPARKGRRPPRQRRAARRPWQPWQIASFTGVTLLSLLALWLLTRPIRAEVAFSDTRKLLASRETAEALTAADRMTERAPWEDVYWFERGRAYLESNRSDLAMPLLEEAIDRDDRGLEQVVTAARVAASHGQNDRAEELYRYSLELEPRAPEMKLEVARFLLAVEEYDDGIDLVEEAVAVRPTNADIWVLLGKARIAAGNPSEAREALRRALELNPEAPEARALLEEIETA